MYIYKPVNTYISTYRGCWDFHGSMFSIGIWIFMKIPNKIGNRDTSFQTGQRTSGIDEDTFGNPIPYALNPNPQALNPKPYTLPSAEVNTIQ